MLILGVIPARKGSKGIKDKNIKRMNGVPLYLHTVMVTVNSMLSDTVISTDIPEILELCLPVRTFNRNPMYCGGNMPMLPVITLVIEQYEKDGRHVDAVMILQPTSPLRTTKHIDDAINAYRFSKCTSLYSGFYMGIKTKDKAYDKHTNKPHFQRNGAIFIVSRELLDKGKLWDNEVCEFEMSKLDSVDIDDTEDFKLAEILMKNREV